MFFIEKHILDILSYMRNFQQPRKLKSFFYTKPVIIFLGILTLFFAWGIVGFVIKMMTTIENRKIVENKVKELEAQKIQLLSDITKLKTSDGVEENIRKKFGLAKEGENMIIVIEDQNKPTTEEIEKSGFFSFFNNLFK